LAFLSIYPQYALYFQIKKEKEEEARKEGRKEGEKRGAERGNIVVADIYTYLSSHFYLSNITSIR
jgi:predicted transposase YdaD